MPKAKNKLVDEAFALYRQGLKLKEIAEKLDLPEGTVRGWKNRHKWGATLQNEDCNVAKKREGGGPR